DEIVLNAAAADAFGASAGQPLRLLVHGVQWDVRIAAIVRNGGFGGVQPLLLAPLARYQRVTGRVGEVNELLVANRGGDQSVAQSAAATQDLRLALVDRATAQQVHDFLAQPEVQRALIDAEAHLKDQERAQVVALRTEAAKPEVTDRFISLVSDPVARRQLFTFAREIPDAHEAYAAFSALRRLAPLSVLELKQAGLDRAAEYGAVVTTVFLVLGIFSLAASVLLIFLVFALLAADRGAELATMRALGMRRRQIMGLFLFEGLVYDLAGAALGAAAGVGATYLAAGSLAQSLAPFGLHVARHVEPRSLLLAFCAGVLLTFGTMLLAAWRVSHTQIVAATRGEAVAEGHWGLVGVGGLLLLGAWLAWRRWSVPPIFYEPRPPLLVPGVLSLALLGAVCVLLAAPALWRTRGGEALAGGLGTLAGVGLLAIWLRALAQLPTPGGELRDDAIVVAIGGLVLIVAAVWTATRALGPLARGLDRALSGLARLRLLVRPAAGYLARQRWRTGLTVVMFGMVIFIMVAALTLINVLLNAYAANTAPVAGFELRADARGAAIPDMGAALAQAPAVSRASFGAIGGVSTLDLQVVQLGLPASSWHDATVAAVDDGFLDGVQVGFARRAPGYRDDAAVWRALRERPGAAVVSASLLDSAVAVGGSPEDATMPPATLWARPSDGGKPVKLTIIGVLDARAELDPAIYTSRATVAGLGVPLPDPTTYYFAVAPGVKVADAAQGLQVSFADQSLAVTDLGDTLRIGQSIRLLLTRLVQGFMGLGLVAGVAALGIIGVQAVIERRQQLGTLRALGYTRWQVRGTLAFESAVVAVLGIALGVALGLVLARSLVALLGAAHPEVRFAVPAGQLALTAAVAWLGATLAIVVAAWQAGRVSPADALRVA
ncbi:MAG TPA: FtsX-like permease family protein, partial [Thermomicrobiales bacterium]|nr:FtsX-like permease family protein [Thermomicrobiales bacterium]